MNIILTPFSGGVCRERFQSFFEEKSVMKIATLILVSFLAISAAASELQIFAAISLTDALKEIATLYENKTGNPVLFNLGASSMLARQISEGSPADVFFSADEDKMDDLQKKQLIVNETRRSLLSNSLVIVIPFDSNSTISDPHQLAKSNWKIAIAEPKTVPAGIYAKKYLQNIGLWSKLMDRIVPTENVRAALAVVESGNVDAGIVYKTDAAISRRVKIAYEIPVKDTPKIIYPVAVIKDTKNLEAAKSFVEYLASEESKAIFTKYGFLVP
jgi:molybdate transport system substrate-binding protein